jgi:hypothetical protein
VIDLTKVTIVSQHGENILFQMMTEGARLAGQSLIARVVIQQLEQRRHHQEKQRNAKSGRRANFAVGLVVLGALTGQFSRASTQRQPQAVLDRPAIKELSTSIPDDRATLGSILAVRSQMPLGSLDILSEYEREMTSISNAVSLELAQIVEGAQQGQINPKEAEYLLWERYQTAMMQFQPLVACTLFCSTILTRRSPRSRRLLDLKMAKSSWRICHFHHCSFRLHW